jgi:biopolymer transport protein ExbD
MVIFQPPQHTAAVAEATAALPPKKGRRAKRGSMEGEMDLTPMVDVVFQLLIFFMVTASFKMQRSLEQPKPEDNEEQSSQSLQDLKDNPDYVIVTVDATNTFQVESSAFDDIMECPSEQELLVKLRQAKAGDSQGNIPTKMLVLGNGEALHERVVMALDAGTDVGMEDVQLMLVEGDDEG